MRRCDLRPTRVAPNLPGNQKNFKFKFCFASEQIRNAHSKYKRGSGELLRTEFFVWFKNKSKDPQKQTRSFLGPTYYSKAMKGRGEIMSCREMLERAKEKRGRFTIFFRPSLNAMRSHQIFLSRDWERVCNRKQESSTPELKLHILSPCK